MIKKVLIVIALFAVGLVIGAIVNRLLLNPTPSEPTVKYYSFNQEIKGIPKSGDNIPYDETSVTFTSWTIISGQTNDFVRIYYTLRNIGSTTMFCSFSEITPTLEFDNQYYNNFNFFEGQKFEWTFDGDVPLQLMPNQALTNGVLQYEINKGSQPTRLLHPLSDNPEIIVNFG